MWLLEKIFKNRRRDLGRAYRELLAKQSDPVVCGVLIHAVEGLEAPSNDTSLSKLVCQCDETDLDVSIGAIAMAQSTILLQSAHEAFVGRDTVMREVGTELQIKKAAAVYAYGMLVSVPLISAFSDVGLISSQEDRKKLIEKLASAVLNSLFLLASTDQRASICERGQAIYKELISEGAGGKGIEFAANINKLVGFIAMNWQGKKVPDKELYDASTTLASTLIGALN